MTALLLALAAGAGTHLLFTRFVLGQRELRTVSRVSALGAGRRDDWLVQAGLAEVPARELTAVIVSLMLVAGLGGYAVFGGVLPPLALALFAGTMPIAAYRTRRATRRAAAMEAWPRLLEELRILTSSLGRSIPQALVEIGRRAPTEMQPAFASARREWLLSTDFTRTVHVLKVALADPTADAVCETLLVAHEVGGTDVDRRLVALIEDRIHDAEGRKDARSRQAGARFARRFVLIVPAGMALAGMSVGTGRAAYQTTGGQVLVVIAIALVVACWVWAGRIMALPPEERVFSV